MKQLTKADILKLAATGDTASPRIVKLKQELFELVPLEEKRHSTTSYIMDVLKAMINYNEHITTFSESKGPLLLLPLNSALSELNQLIEKTVVNLLLNLDLSQIQITDEQSNFAANTMLCVLEIHQAGFPDERIQQSQQAIAEKKADYLNSKHEQQRTNDLINARRAREEGGVNLETLLNYFNSEAQRIVAIADLNARVEQYDELTHYVAHKMNELEWHSEHYQQILESLEHISNKVNQEKPILAEQTLTIEQSKNIIEQFDKLSTRFRDKITSLQDRRTRASDEQQKKYTPAINDANALLNKLTNARDAFQKNRNIGTFTNITKELFAQFENNESFKTNRSSPWFRTYISQPFEQLKAFINLITRFIYTLFGGQHTNTDKYKGAFFSPSQTDTSRKFNELKQNTEQLLTINRVH